MTARNNIERTRTQISRTGFAVGKQFYDHGGENGRGGKGKEIRRESVSTSHHARNEEYIPASLESGQNGKD